MNKLKIAIVGLNFGRHIIESLQSPPWAGQIEIVAVCDMNSGKAEEYATLLGVPGYCDLDSMLLDENIAAVGLFTGPNGRADLIRKIIRAGRDVMTTKPFESDPEKALEILKEAQTLGRIVHMNSPSPVFTDDLKVIDEWRRTQSLGRPVGCQCSAWAHYEEKADGTWYDDPVKCPAAPIFRLGIYLINDLVRLFGPADSVSVMQSGLLTGRPTPDNAQMRIAFKNGALAQVFASFCIDDGQPYQNSMVLHFEHGTIYRNVSPRISGQNGCLLQLVKSDGSGGRTLKNETVATCSGAYQWDLFKRAVDGETIENPTTPEQVAEALKIIRAMTKSQFSRGIEKV